MPIVVFDASTFRIDYIPRMSCRQSSSSTCQYKRNRLDHATGTTTQKRINLSYQFVLLFSINNFRTYFLHFSPLIFQILNDCNSRI